MLSAVQTIKAEMMRIHCEMADCIEPSGYVRASRRYEYQCLIEELRSFKEALDYLEGQFGYTLPRR